MNKIKQQEEREKFQNEVEEASKLFDYILLEAATGTGKGRAVLKCIDSDKSGIPWLIVVPEILQIENLKSDIEKHNFTHLYDTKIADIICYNSFEKYAGQRINLWFNEVHRLSELRTDIAQTIKYNRIIADSATVPKDVRNRLEKLGKFYNHKLPLDEAVDRGIVPAPRIFIKYTDLDDKIPRNDVKIQKKKVKYTDKEYSKYLDSTIEFWKEKYNRSYEEWMKNRMVRLGSQRKKFMSETKTEDLKNLISILDNKRLLCFTGSIEQCDEIGGKYAIHSKKGKKHNLEMLEAFNSKKISTVYVQKMGKEGLNLTDIEVVIVTQLGSGNDDGLQIIQQIGRALRGDYPEVYILVTRNTADEKYLNKALENINSRYINYI